MIFYSVWKNITEVELINRQLTNKWKNIAVYTKNGHRSHRFYFLRALYFLILFYYFQYFTYKNASKMLFKVLKLKLNFFRKHHPWCNSVKYRGRFLAFNLKRPIDLKMEINQWINFKEKQPWYLKYARLISTGGESESRNRIEWDPCLKKKSLEL